MARHEEGFLPAKDNLRLFWESDTPDSAPKAHVALVHGYGEHCGRYRAFIDMLVGQGYAVHAFDLRGHGQSDGRRNYCDSFSDYVDDLHAFMAHVRSKAGSERLFMLAHSFGGLVAVHGYPQEGGALRGLVLSSPCLGLAVRAPPLKVLGGKLLDRVVPWIALKTEVTPQMLTRDQEVLKALAKDRLYNHVVTPRWYLETLRAQALAEHMGPAIRGPTLLVCGDADGVVSTPVSRRFFETIGASDKRYREYPGMLHETLNEIGKEEVWGEITGWISKHL